MDAEQTTRARQLIEEARETGDVRAIAQALSMVMDEIEGKQQRQAPQPTASAHPGLYEAPRDVTPPTEETQASGVIEAAPPSAAPPSIVPGAYEPPRLEDGATPAHPAHQFYEPRRNDDGTVSTASEPEAPSGT